MPTGRFIRSVSALIGGLAVLLALSLSQGCQKQILDKEAAHGLSQDPYPEEPLHMARTLKILVWPATILEENKKDFEKRYGVKLEIDTFSNDEEAYDLLVKNPNKWDVVMVSQYMGDRMRRDGLLTQVPRLNNYIYEHIDASVLNKSADPHMLYFIPFDYAAMGISFNVDYIAGFPRKWAYLSEHKNNPYLYGRFVMTDDMRYAIATAMLCLGYDPSKAGPKEVQLAKDLLIFNVKEFGLRFLPDSQINSEMVSRNAILAITWSGEAASILKAKPNCRFLIPEGEGITTTDGFAIPKGSNAPETAALFIEFMLHPYSSLLVANSSMYATTNMRSMKYVDRFVLNGPSCMLPPPGLRLHMKYIKGEELKIYEDAWAEVKNTKIDPSRINIIPAQ